MTKTDPNVDRAVERAVQALADPDPCRLPAGGRKRSDCPICTRIILTDFRDELCNADSMYHLGRKHGEEACRDED